MPRLINDNPPKCTKCEKMLDGYTNVMGEGEPEYGCITVCLYCGCIMEFTKTLDLVEIRSETLVELDPFTLMELVRAVRLVKKTLKGF